MLQVLRRSQRWIMAFVVAALAVAFAFFLAVGGGPLGGRSAAVAVAVGDRAYDFRDFDRERQLRIEEYRRIAGDAFDAEAAAAFIDQQVAEMLVQRAILAQEGERLGLRVGQAELRAYLRSVPGGKDDAGRLDAAAWRSYAEREFGSERRFESALREEFLARKTARLLRASAAVSDAEVRDLLRHRLEEVQVAYVAIDPAPFRAQAGVEDAEVSALLESDPERVRRSYEARASEFDRPEQVRARHVLVRVEPGEGADAEKARAAAREKALAVAARVRGGEPFEAVAREVSDDPGSRASGGDLGFFPRGRMVKPFEDAAFSLPVGEVSDPVESSFGYHVLRVEERRAAELIPFEEAKAAVSRDILLDEKAAAVADALVAKLLEAIGEGKRLVDAARERGLVIERPDPLRRRGDGAIPRLGVSREALSAVFALTDEAPTLARAFEIGGKRVLFERLGGSKPTDAQIEAQLASAREGLRREREAQVFGAWLDGRRRELEARGAIAVNVRRDEAPEAEAGG